MEKTILLIAVLFLMIGCGKAVEPNLGDLKQNQAARHELFTAIINDQLLLGDFLDQLTINEKGMSQLVLDDDAMQYIFDMQNLYLMAHTKPETMLLMINNLAHLTRNDSSIRSMIINLPQMQQLSNDQSEVARK